MRFPCTTLEKEASVAAPPKKAKNTSDGWYMGVIDDDDLIEIDGSERTLKSDTEELYLNLVEVS